MPTLITADQSFASAAAGLYGRVGVTVVGSLKEHGRAVKDIPAWLWQAALFLFLYI